MKKLPAVLEELIDRLETVKIVEPQNAVPEKATVVGIMPEELQRLDALRNILRLDKRYKSEQVNQELGMYQLHIASEWHEAVEKIFWLGVRTAFPELNGKIRIGFGEGWQVFWEKKDGDEECQCPRCAARREAGLSVPGIEIVRIPMDAELLGGLGGLLSLLSREPKPGESNEDRETTDSDNSGESQAAGPRV